LRRELLSELVTPKYDGLPVVVLLRVEVSVRLVSPGRQDAERDRFGLIDILARRHHIADPANGTSQQL
jgi:hypothetical protein